MKNLLAALIVLIVSVSNIAGCSEEKSTVNNDTIQSTETMQTDSMETEISEESEDNMIDINVKIGNETFNAKLYNNKTTQELIKSFPLNCNMTELHGNEKYYYMPQSLPTESETPSTLNKGEIMLYGSDCLVIFYDTFPNSYSYTRLGYIEDTTKLETAVGKGDVNVTLSAEK